MDFLYFILVGGMAGWLAGQLSKGAGFGIIKNILIGVAGAIVGGWGFSLIGIKAYGFIGSLVTATVGALALLWVLGKTKK